jgi:hypothetical protein
MIWSGLGIISVGNHASRPKNERTSIIAPSHGLFLTCRGKKYIQYLYNNVQYMISMKGVLNAKSLLWGVAF